MVLAPNKTLAAQLYGEMKEFFPENAVEYFCLLTTITISRKPTFPSSDTFIEKDASVNEHIEQMRLSATKALLERRDVVVVASVSAIYGLGDPDLYLKMMLHLTVGMLIDQRAILRRLAELQYTRNDQAFQRGTFRVRGEVIDVFPAESDDIALRIELFDEEVERLSLFDPLTGHVEGTVPLYHLSQDPLRNAAGAHRPGDGRDQAGAGEAAQRCCWPTTSCCGRAALNPAYPV